MADIKISQLGSAITVDDSDIVPVVSGGNTLKATAAQLKEHAIGNTSISGIGDGSVTGAISALNSDKQPKTLATSITVDGTPQTTVEGALGAINTDLGSTKQALSTTNNVLGAKNLFHNTATTTVVTGVTYTVNPDGSITLTGTQATSPKSHLKIYNDVDVPKGTYILTGANGEDTQIALYNVTSGSAVGIGSDFGSGFEFTLSSDAKLRIDCYTFSAHGNYNETIYPMIRPVAITDDTYVPYAKTNRELTVDAVATTVSNQITSSVGTFDLNYISKKNGIVQVDIQLQISENVTGYHNVATIPQGYEPVIDFTATGYLYRASEDKQMHGSLVFRNARNVQNVGALVSGDILRLSATYISK